MYQGERGGCARGGCEDDYPEAAATASFVAFFISDDRPTDRCSTGLSGGRMHDVGKWDLQERVVPLDGLL